MKKNLLLCSSVTLFFIGLKEMGVSSSAPHFVEYWLMWVSRIRIFAYSHVSASQQDRKYPLSLSKTLWVPEYTCMSCDGWFWLAVYFSKVERMLLMSVKKRKADTFLCIVGLQIRKKCYERKNCWYFYASFYVYYNILSCQLQWH